MERHEVTDSYPLTQRESAEPPVAGVIIVLCAALLPVYAVAAALVYSLVAP